jgi:hypothetical protein
VALWDFLAADDMPESHVALLTEACRARDRLDQLDEILSGDAEVWARLVHRTRTDDYELRIDDALAKALSTANSLRLLLDKIPVPTQGNAGGIRDQLAARRAARKTGAEGSPAAGVRQRRGRARRD